MPTIVSKNLTDAWLKLCSYVYTNGIKAEKDALFSEALNVPLIIENSNETEHDLYLKYFGNNTFNKVKSIYRQSGRKIHGYNYGERIYNYCGLDQVKKVEELLRKDLSSRSATIVLSNPTEDACHKPCIMDINFKIRNEKLLMTLLFKSSDVSKKFVPDICCLSEIHATLSRNLYISRGPIYAFIMSAQILQKDSKTLKTLLKNNDKIKYFNSDKTIQNWNKEADHWNSSVNDPEHYVNIEKGYERFLNFTNKILKDSTDIKDEPILDLGCGTGIIAKTLNKYSKNVFGIDISDKMIAKARETSKNIKFIIANCLDTPFPDNYFKVIASRGILISHVGNRFNEDLVKEVHRILKSNGYFITDFLVNVGKKEIKIKKNKALFSKNKIRKLLEQNGFRVVDFDGNNNQRVNSVLCIKK